MTVEEGVVSGKSCHAGSLVYIACLLNISREHEQRKLEASRKEYMSLFVDHIRI